MSRPLNNVNRHDVVAAVMAVHAFINSVQARRGAPQSDDRIIVAGADDWDGSDTFEGHPLLIRFDP